MKSVIFDLDGTLVDSQQLQFKSYKRAFKEIGLSLSWKEWINYWVKNSIDANDWGKHKKIHFDVSAVRHRKKQIYDELIKTKLNPKPGAINLVRDLKINGFKLAIASSSRIESIQLITDQLFPNMFNVLQSDTELKKRKPHPDVFMHCMRELGSAPNETLIIEDSLSGYNAAIESGCACIVCPDKAISTRGDFPKAKKIISSLEELKVPYISELLFLK